MVTVRKRTNVQTRTRGALAQPPKKTDRASSRRAKKPIAREVDN